MPFLTGRAPTEAAQPRVMTSRSPSPAPPPPLANSPGPRAAALQKVFNEALQHTLDTCSYTNFAGCFPTTARYAGASLEALWTDFKERLGGLCKVSRLRIQFDVF